MPFPNQYFGLIDNPLIDSPFIAGQGGSAPTPPSGNNFLLLNGSPMLLLSGDDLALL